jgi:cell division protein FtsB
LAFKNELYADFKKLELRVQEMERQNKALRLRVEAMEREMRKLPGIKSASPDKEIGLA